MSHVQNLFAVLAVKFFFQKNREIQYTLLSVQHGANTFAASILEKIC